MLLAVIHSMHAGQLVFPSQVQPHLARRKPSGLRLGRCREYQFGTGKAFYPRQHGTLTGGVGDSKDSPEQYSARAGPARCGLDDRLCTLARVVMKNRWLYEKNTYK